MAAEQLALADWRLVPHEDRDGFRHAATAYFGAHDAVHALKAQIWADAGQQPIEDASADWPVEISLTERSPRPGCRIGKPTRLSVFAPSTK